MPEPIVDDGDQDETVKTASGKEVVLPPPEGKSSPLYNAEPADSKGNDSPYTTDFLKRFDPAKTDALHRNACGHRAAARCAAEQRPVRSR